MGQINPVFGSIVPSQQQLALQNNYLAFNAGANDFAQQYLPEVYEAEVERYGNRTLNGFLRMVGAEMPMSSDQVIWSEQNRLHVSYVNVAQTGGADSATLEFALGGNPAVSNAIFPNDTIVVMNPATGVTLKGVVKTSLPGGLGQQVIAYPFTAANWDALGVGATNLKLFVYGSIFAKGTVGPVDNGLGAGSYKSIQPSFTQYSNNPIIIKDSFQINGSDMAQIGWVEVTTENGANGYLWYMKSEHETRLRFDDYLETAMIEAVPAGATSGAATQVVDTQVGDKGSDGIFYAVENRGNIWGGGNPTTLADWDTIISRLDKQGAIEENVVFVDRDFSFDIDDMLSLQSSNAAGGVSYGLFDNEKDMALNLGFTGFRRGYDFYKSDWKYLNDPTMRGGLPTGAGSGRVNGLLVPAGSTSVYDQILGKNAKRPFLHVRYRASETEDRRYKTWITGSAGGAETSSLDAMEVHFLSERAVCTLGANNFFLFQE